MRKSSESKTCWVSSAVSMFGQSNAIRKNRRVKTWVYQIGTNGKANWIRLKAKLKKLSAEPSMTTNSKPKVEPTTQAVKSRRASAKVEGKLAKQSRTLATQ